MGKKMLVLTSMPPLSPIPPWEKDSSDEESEGEGDHPIPEELSSPQTWIHILNGRLLISEREESDLCTLL
jgi:hypothetical protein